MSIEQAQALFPDCQKTEWFDAPCDYSPIIDSFGKVLVRVDDDDYSGDTFALLSKGNRIGLLTFGWGSCSGCDALQGCESYKELGELIDILESGIKWFDSLAEAQAYISNDQITKGSYCYYAETWGAFKRQVLALSSCPQ
jgi:hypothetical protein